MKHYGDITKIDGSKVEPVDIVTGGSPCQDLSVAGKRKGLSGERSGLFMEQIRIIKEMRGHDRRNGRTDQFVRPRYMVWENVPGAFTSNGGEDFRAVLEETARVSDPDAVIPRPPFGQWQPVGCILGDGYSIVWRVHDAQFWGVPQRRKRVSLVADFGGQSAPEILFERKGLPRSSNSSEKEKENIASETGKSTTETISFLEKSGKEGGGKGILIQHEKSATLSTLNNQSIFTGVDLYSGNESGDVAVTLTTRGNAAGATGPYVMCEGVDVYTPSLTGEVACALTAACGGTTTSGAKVLCSDIRRLTPLECERLQGFPDGWTDIGDWIDSKGKKHKGGSDSPRYKALGNSIALPFWEWLAQRMVAQYEHEVTMASLFDGIGGFPLVFSRCGCKPVWASEIEEFPIAVTKYHFEETSA